MPLSPLLRQRVVAYQLARTDALDAAMSLEQELGVLEQENERVEVQRFMDVQDEERRRAELRRNLGRPPSPSSPPSPTTRSKKCK
jgi:hypothetical protein